jgi:hypothetical protein
MQDVIAFLKDNASWLFGSTSVAAVLLALLGKRKAEGGGDAKPRGGTAAAPASGYPVAVIVGIVACLAIALTTALASFGTIDVSTNTITSGGDSVNVISEGSTVTVGK